MSTQDWKIPPTAQPQPDRYSFDLDDALSAVVSLASHVPEDAFTAQTLGTERSGHAVLIDRSGLFLTVGYLITEAESVWLTTGARQVVEAHALGVDGQSGLGLVHALAPVDLPALVIGSTAGLGIGTPVVVAGGGGRHHAVAAEIVARHEFAGYWEYLLEDAIFTAPSHPHWGGTAMIGPDGSLLGIGSLQLQQERVPQRVENLNMVVPAEQHLPVREDLVRLGRPDRSPRPWLGIFATEVLDQVAIAGIVEGGPAERAGLQVGDLVVSVSGRQVGDLPALFRAVWSLGTAGVAVPLTVRREARVFDVVVPSVDRYRLLKRRTLH